MMPDSINGKRIELINYKREKGIDGIKSTDGTDHIYFMSMVEDIKGALWMSTYNEGVWRYKGKKEHTST